MVSLEPVLIALARRIGHSGGSATLSTSELGKLAGVSQQTASRYLGMLDDAGWISRGRSGRGFEVRLTADGVSVLRGIHSGIGEFLEPDVKRSFEGRIASGIGEGAYYVGEYASRIEQAVGYRPFPGTLNVRFGDDKPELTSKGTIDVEGFESGGRSFGRVGLTPIRLHLKGRHVDCHAIIPERTHHRRDIEIVSGDNLRKKHGLRDGDKALITLE
jgi:riboflavin kinase, archaea type